MFMRNMARFGEKTFMKTPRVKIMSVSELHKINGILLYLANSINTDYDHKNSITIFHEHGTSDKQYGGGSDKAKRKLEKYDYIFLSGPKNRKRLQDVGLELPDEKLINIGGLRLDDYINGRISREKEIERLGIIDTSRKNILYAPTWRFGNGTLKKYGRYFAEEVTKEFNLILRPHYHDRRRGASLYQACKLRGIKHLYFSQPANILKSDTLNDFAASDLMISDISSVIYEYLITGNPMIIVQNDFEARHTMPDDMNIMKHTDIFDGSQDINIMIRENLQNHKYKEGHEKLLKNCFYSTDGTCLSKAVDFIQKL